MHNDDDGPSDPDPLVPSTAFTPDCAGRKHDDDEPDGEDDGGDDLRFNPNLQPTSAEDIGLRFGLEAATDPAVRYCRNAMILSLVYAVQHGLRGMHYSRSTNGYPRAEHPPVSYRAMMSAAASMEKASDYFVHYKMKPADPAAVPGRRRQSYFLPGPLLLVGDHAELERTITLEPPQRIILRDKKKNSKPFPENADTRAFREFIAVYDDQISKLSFLIEHPEASKIGPDVYACAHKRRLVCIDMRQRYPVRILSRTMRSGGRFYRTFWLNLPREHRETLTIDGEPAAEHDLAGCHLRLAYFALGIEPPFDIRRGDDPYALPTHQMRRYPKKWRKVVKRAVSILWNAKSRNQARGPIAAVIAKEFRCGTEEMRKAAADRIIADIIAHYTGLERLWYSGIGLKFQFADSEVMRVTLLKLLEIGIVALPLHDAILAKQSQIETAGKVFEDVFETTGKQLAWRVGRYYRKLGRDGQRLTNGEVEGSEGEGCPRIGGKNLDCIDCSRNSLSSVASTTLCLRFPDDTSIAKLIADDPVLNEIRSLTVYRKTVSDGVLWVSIIRLAQLFRRGVALDRAASVWRNAMDSALNHPPTEASVADVIVRVRKQRHINVAQHRLASVCAATPAECEALGLAALKPKPTKTPSQPLSRNERRKAERWASGIVPNLVPVSKIAPWPDGCRSAWYAANKCAIQKQRVALDAAVVKGQHGIVARVRLELYAAERIRSIGCRMHNLPVDQLFRALRDALVLADQIGNEVEPR